MGNASTKLWVLVVVAVAVALFCFAAYTLRPALLRRPVPEGGSNLNTSFSPQGIRGTCSAAAQAVPMPFLVAETTSQSINATTMTNAPKAIMQPLDDHIRTPFSSPPTNPHYIDWAARTGLAPLRTCKAPSSAVPDNQWIKNTAAIEHLLLPPGPGRGVAISIVTEAGAARMGISSKVRLPVTLLTIKHFDDANIAHQLFYSGLSYALIELRHRFGAAHSAGSLMVLLHGSRGRHVRKTARKTDGSLLSWLQGVVGISYAREGTADQEQEAQPSSNSGVLWSQTLASMLVPLLRLESLNLSYSGHAYVVVQELVTVDVPTAAMLFPFACFVDNLPPSKPMLSVRDALYASSTLTDYVISNN